MSKLESSALARSRHRFRWLAFVGLLGAALAFSGGLRAMSRQEQVLLAAAEAPSESAPGIEPFVGPELAARLTAMERALDQRRLELGIPGVALAIVSDDKVVYLKGLGWRDLEEHLPVTPDTLFSIASSTKSFTSMLAAMSLDEGKLSLDDPPAKYLPYFHLADPHADAAVTLRDLLSHRVGLADNDRIWYGGHGREETIRAHMVAPLASPLRTEFRYNNILYSAAGEAIARAQGKPWEVLIAERIFKPLGMSASDTSVAVMQKGADVSLGYSPESELAVKRSMDVDNVAAAGAINSTARDMAKWVRLILGRGVFKGRRLVSERAFAELWTPQIDMPMGQYGLGWMLQEWQGHRLYTHGGAVDGFSCMVAVMPDQKLGLVMLTNIGRSPLLGEGPRLVWQNLVGEGTDPPVTAAAHARAAVAPGQP